LEKRLDSYESVAEVDLPEGAIETKDVIEAIKNLQVSLNSKMVDANSFRRLET
jgi:hypothetical protein